MYIYTLIMLFFDINIIICNIIHTLTSINYKILIYLLFKSEKKKYKIFLHIL